MRAAVYTRISQDKTGRAAGVTRQLEDCVELAEQLGWEVAEVYTDNDASAASGKPRAQYLRMLADIDAGKIDGIIAWHPDRLYRKVPDLGDLIDVCKRNNTQIATAKAGSIDLTTPTGRLVAGLLAQVATYEGEAKSDRWKRSVLQARQAGRFSGSGSRTFGYRLDGTPDPAEAETVRWMADEVLSGRSLTDLCRELAETGVKTTRGNEWQTASLRNLLTNPRLAGYSTLSKLVTVGRDEKGKPIKRRQSDIVGRGEWQPILEPDTFETVRAVLTSRRRSGSSARVALLLGLLHCGRCDERMVTGGRGSKTGGTLRTYRCQAIPGRLDGCGTVSGAAEHVEAVVESYAQTRLADPRVRAHLLTLHSSVEATRYANEITTLEHRIGELEAQLDEPGTPVATILRAIDRARTRLEERQVLLAASLPAPVPAAGDNRWPADLARRRRLIDLVVERVDLEPASRMGRFDPDRVKIKRREF